jgi:Uma2 family endonuclease
MQPLGRVTEDEYLARERSATQKHELINGHIVAMAGGSPRHNAICANLLRALGNLVRGGPCTPLTSDQQVHVPTSGLFTYPDVTIVCGEARFHPKDSHVLLNPTLLIEVVSPTTEAYDRGAKFRHCKSMAQLQEYVLVGSVERLVDHYRRLETGRWELSSFEDPGSVVPLPALGIRLPFDEIYEGTERLPL